MKTLKALIALGVIIVGIYVGMEVIPPYVSNFQFEDDIRTEARFAATSDKSEGAIRQNVLKKAQSYELPLTEEMIHVERDGKEVRIWADYTVAVDLRYKTLTLEFHPSSQKRENAPAKGAP